MHGMGRLKLIFILAVAALLAAGPTLHNHPLIPAPGSESGSTADDGHICSVCVSGSALVASPVTTLTLPQLVVYAVPLPQLVTPPSTATRQLPSRAPPMA